MTLLVDVGSYDERLDQERKVARADEWGGLESRCGLRVTVGSNPTPSAISIRTKQWLLKGSSSLCEKLRENVAAFGG